MPSKSKSKTVRLTMGQAIINYLKVQYSQQDEEINRLIQGVFGIFGHGNVSGLAQGLYEYGKDLPYYQPCNEQSQVHTAAGYAKAMRRLSTYACTASVGPGSTNMLTAAAGATINRLPVLLLPSDYYATRYQGNVLQQLEHPISADVSLNDAFRPVSRFFDRISRPEQILTALPRAMRVLTDPADTGVVTLSLPQDVQIQAYDYPASFFKEKIWRIRRAQPELQDIEEAAKWIAEAKTPVIIAGGGVIYSNASDDLYKFSTKFGIPVGETIAGKGAMKKDAPTFLGAQGVQGDAVCSKIISRADLVICVGTRLTDFTTGSRALFQHPKVRFVHINVNVGDAYKLGALPIVADARDGLRALIQAASKERVKPDIKILNRVKRERTAWERKIKKESYREFPGEPMNEGLLIKTVFDESKPGDTAVGASSGLLGNSFKIWDATKKRRALLEFGFSCMGYEIPAGLGTRLAQPKGEIFVFIGDGTYLMNPTEIVTCLQEKKKITLIVAENHGYQCIRAHQMHRAGRAFGNEFRCRDPKTDRLEGDYIEVDYAKTSEGFGAKAWNVKTEEELRSALRAARKEKNTCVIVAETSGRRYPPGSEMWWDVGVAEVSGDPVTRKLRRQYEDEVKEHQRFYY